MYPQLSYSSLTDVLKRALRNGNWRRLPLPQKGLFRCALWITNARGRITNKALREQVLGLLAKLLQTYRHKIAQAGEERAKMIYVSFTARGGFGWVPQLKEWLEDSTYVWYFGLMQVNTP